MNLLTFSTELPAPTGCAGARAIGASASIHTDTAAPPWSPHYNSTNRNSIRTNKVKFY